MSSVAMTLKDQGRGSQLDAICPVINRTSEEGKFKEQFACGNDYSPKVRKPYTVTKQRERWTDVEHKKFLEALKLYGRAWRRIEEHVGTKTAVQIRSHAQKFFSKVVRESNGLNESSLKLNDIPPPRPKRKPMYPYPRKLVIPAKTGTPLSDERPRITSADLSVSEKENQSPTSVLSEIGSDTIIDSNTPNGSPSPVSSGAGLNTSGCVQSKPIMSLEENGSPSPVQVDANANLEEQVKLKLELFPRVDSLTTGEGTADASPTQFLKLFGKTVLITQGCKPLSTSRTCHTQDMETNEGMERQTQTSDSMQMKISLENAECEWSALSCGAPAAIYYMPLCENQSSSVFPRWTSNGDASENQSSPVFPRWTSNGDASFPSGQLYNPVPMKVSPSYVGKRAQENEIQDEGSLTASTTGSVIVKEDGDVDRNGDIETECSRSGLEKDKKQSAFLLKASDKICLGEKRAKTRKALKGFVPYKRCLAERDTSEVTSSERENQRIRLCL